MKKIKIIISMLVMALLLALPGGKVNAAGSIGVSVSASSVKIGDKVTVTVSIPQGYMSGIILTYDPGVLSFASCSTESSGGRGDVQFSIYNATTATVTFNAIAEGSSTISASVNGNIGACDENGNDTTLSGASASVTVVNQASSGGDTATKSADNSLSKLTIYPGSISPALQYGVTNYTATVDYSVTSVTVNATPSHAKASVESVTGNTNLQVGQNTIYIKVKAENGTVATYTIVVTRLAQSTGGTTEPEQPDEGNENTGEKPEENKTLEFSYSGQKLTVAEEIPDEAVVADFSKTTMQINGQEVQALSYNKAKLTLLYLNNEEGYPSWYVYDAAEKNVYPFIKLTAEKNYVIILRPSVEMAPEGFRECTLSIEGKGTIIAYQAIEENKEDDEPKATGFFDFFAPAEVYAAEPEASDYYLVYCMNSAGEEGWYMYDSVEGTYQRYIVMDIQEESVETNTETGVTEKEYQKLEKELYNSKVLTTILLGVVFLLIVGLIVTIVLTVVKRHGANGEMDEEAEYTEQAFAEIDDTTVEDTVDLEATKEINLSAMEDAVILATQDMVEEKEEESAESVEVDSEAEIEAVKMREAEEAARANAKMFMADLESKEEKKDDFDVEVSPAEDFPSEEEYNDEDLTIINF